MSHNILAMGRDSGIRFQRLLEERGITQTDLAKRANLSQQYISKIALNGIPEGISHKKYLKIAHVLDMTIDQLTRELEGGPIQQFLEPPERIFERYRINMPTSVPIYEEYPIHGGKPTEIIDYVSVVRDAARNRKLEGYVVHGNCLEPDVQEGDIIIIDREGQPDVGNIVVCLIGEELHLAKLKKIADELYLEDNHGTRRLSEVRLSAPVIEVRRKLK